MAISRISVVICTRNRPRMLATCLESIAKSYLLPKEVVVVDQSDNLDSARIAESMKAEYPVPLRHVLLTSVGHTKARNAGVKGCRGEIIAFTDDDCIVDKNWLSSLQREFDDTTAQCVCGQTKPAVCSPRKGFALLSTLQRKRRKMMRGRLYAMNAGKGNNMALIRNTILDLGGFNEIIGVGTPISAADDTDLFFRILETGGTIIYTPEAVVYHSQPSDLQTVIKKKYGYALSFAAVTAGRIRYGSVCALGLLAAKFLYELCYLFIGGLIRFNRESASIGWSSLRGTLAGSLYLWDSEFCDNIWQLTLMAKESQSNIEHPSEIYIR